MRDSPLARKNVSRISCWGRFAMGRSVGHGLGWLEFFEEVPEPRQKAKVLYPLPELLLCCLVGVLCGAEGWVEVEEYGEAKLDFLRRFLPFDHGIPSHDTFSDVFNALDPEGFKAAFIAWTAALQENIREIVAVDGKTLRRSFDRSRGQGPIHMISAWAAGQRLVLGQLAVDAKENEITAIPELLALLTLKGAIITIDTIGADHGRVETRRHWIVGDTAWLQERHPAWPDLTSIAMIEAVREEPGKPASCQTRFYITSIAPDAAEFAHAARQHWAIENGLHWVLDVIYREDQCRIRKRNGPANFATIRHMTLNLLQRTKTTKKKSIRVKRGLAALDEAFLQSVLMAA